MKKKCMQDVMKRHKVKNGGTPKKNGSKENVAVTPEVVSELETTDVESIFARSQRRIPSDPTPESVAAAAATSPLLSPAEAAAAAAGPSGIRLSATPSTGKIGLMIADNKMLQKDRLKMKRQTMIKNPKKEGEEKNKVMNESKKDQKSEKTPKGKIDRELSKRRDLLASKANGPTIMKPRESVETPNLCASLVNESAEDQRSPNVCKPSKGKVDSERKKRRNSLDSNMNGVAEQEPEEMKAEPAEEFPQMRPYVVQRKEREPREKRVEKKGKLQQNGQSPSTNATAPPVQKEDPPSESTAPSPATVSSSEKQPAKPTAPKPTTSHEEETTVSRPAAKSRLFNQAPPCYENEGERRQGYGRYSDRPWKERNNGWRNGEGYGRHNERWQNGQQQQHAAAAATGWQQQKRAAAGNDSAAAAAAAAAKPSTHKRFASESPVKSSPEKRAEEPRRSRRLSGCSPEAAASAAAAAEKSAAAAVVVGNGRISKRDSSPEVSTTSSEESEGEKREEEKERNKKLVKRGTVGERKEEKKEERRREEEEEKKEEESKKIERRVGMVRKLKKSEEGTTGEKKRVEDKKTVLKEKKKDKEEEKIRPSIDLLRMVAERTVNGHGWMVMRLLSRDARRVAEAELFHAEDVLHLEEFDDENPFTRDDMTALWEHRREEEAEEEGEGVEEGEENRSHAQISAYLAMRNSENLIVREMDGGMSHPESAASAVDPSQLLQHPLATLDAACLLHESQTAAAARLLQKGAKDLREVWLGHCGAKLSREVKRLSELERFEHRQATIQTLERLPLLQMTELRLDLVDEEVRRERVADHLVNCRRLRVLEMNIAPTGPIDGSTASHYALFTRRCYDRAEFTDELEWMLPNIVDGEPDPITHCMPELEHLATNVGNVKLFWQLRDRSPLLRQLRTLRIGTLSRTKELIASSEMFEDTKESRRFKQEGFFALRDAYETNLESVTLRLSDRVGLSGLRRVAERIFEGIGELPPSLRRLSVSLFHNQFSGVCAPYRRWHGWSESDQSSSPPDCSHSRIEEMQLHWERAFDLRGLPALLPPSLKKLSLTVNYETEEDAKCLISLLEILPELDRLEKLEELHIQVWGVRCLQPVVEAVARSKATAARLKRLVVAAYPVEDGFFEPSSARAWLHATLAAFPQLQQIGLHAAVLMKLIPARERRGYSWRNGVARLANELLRARPAGTGRAPAGTNQAPSSARLAAVELAVAPALPALEDGEDYTITPHWEVPFDAEELARVELGEEEEEMEGADTPYSLGGHAGASSDEDDFITDDDEQEGGPDSGGSSDELAQMEDGLEDETERIERRERRREEKERLAIERGERPAVEEEEGECVDFDAISDQEEEEEERRRRCAFVDDEAAESDRVESGGEEGEGEEEGEEGGEKREESAEDFCSSEDEEREREEERQKEERRREKRRMRKEAQLEHEMNQRKRKQAFDSEEEEEEKEEKEKEERKREREEMGGRTKKKVKRQKVIIESDED